MTRARKKHSELLGMPLLTSITAGHHVLLGSTSAILACHRPVRDWVTNSPGLAQQVINAKYCISQL
jgi:hypothetical protein